MPGGNPPPADLAESGDAEGTKKRYFKTDAIGRTYEYDEHGNRIFKTPLHGSLRPPTISAIRVAEVVKAQMTNNVRGHLRWVLSPPTPTLPLKGGGEKEYEPPISDPLPNNSGFGI